MKIALVYILLFATLLPTVSPWGTIAYYHANKDYITRVLCENRDKPQLHCDGKCYLAKQLKLQQNRQDKETTERVQNTPLLQLFCNDSFVFTFNRMVNLGQERIAFAYLTRPYSAPLSPVFQPPGIGC